MVALLNVPALDWVAVRCCKDGEPSPLRELVTVDRPVRRSSADSSPSLAAAPVCEIAVIDAATGKTLLNSLVNPGMSISHSAFRTHGISDVYFASASTWSDVLPELLRITKNRKILAYNADYDIRIIRAECRSYHLHPGHLGDRRNWDCVMNRRSNWLRIRRWLPLGGSHRALDDCLSALDVLRSLAVPARGADLL